MTKSSEKFSGRSKRIGAAASGPEAPAPERLQKISERFQVGLYIHGSTIFSQQGAERLGSLAAMLWSPGGSWRSAAIRTCLQLWTKPRRSSLRGRRSNEAQLPHCRLRRVRGGRRPSFSGPAAKSRSTNAGTSAWHERHPAGGFVDSCARIDRAEVTSG